MASTTTIRGPKARSASAILSSWPLSKEKKKFWLRSLVSKVKIFYKSDVFHLYMARSRFGGNYQVLNNGGCKKPGRLAVQERYGAPGYQDLGSSYMRLPFPRSLPDPRRLLECQPFHSYFRQ